MIKKLERKQAREDVEPFVRDPRALEVWGTELFNEAAGRIEWGRA